MAKHRRQNNNVARKVAAASAAVVSATVLTPSVAGAVEVVVPNTDIRVNVPGLDAVPGLNTVPNIDTFVPSLQAEANTYAANVTAPVVEQVAAATGSSSQGQAIVDAVRTKIGSPYGWGAAGPSAFDCSGLTSWAYQQIGKTIPRTSQAQAAQGQRVSLDQLQPGDIIAYYGGASHVGIYIGNGMIIDSLNSGSLVAERPLHYMPIHSAVRF